MTEKLQQEPLFGGSYYNLDFMVINKSVGHSHQQLLKQLINKSVFSGLV